MRTLGNIIWFIFGGIEIGLSWLLLGALFCITIIGIPAGKQCFKMAEITFFPFKKEVEYKGKLGSAILNVLWIIFFGWEYALSYIAAGLLMMITIIGIPFGSQCFKLAKLSLFPFGADIVDIK